MNIPTVFLSTITIATLLPSLIPSSPIVSIVTTNQFPPILLSSGVILNTYYILTTQYPIGAHTRSHLCVLPFTSLVSIPKQIVDNFCYRIQDIIYPTVYMNLVVIELVSPIFYFYGISPGPIVMAPFDINQVKCYKTSLLYDYKQIKMYRVLRGAYFSDIQLVSKYYKPNSSDPYIWVKYSKAEPTCIPFNGSPLYCDFTIVALMSFDNVPCRAHHLFQENCLYNCTFKQSIRYMNLMIPQAQRFIKQFLYELPQEYSSRKDDDDDV